MYLGVKWEFVVLLESKLTSLYSFTTLWAWSHTVISASSALDRLLVLQTRLAIKVRAYPIHMVDT